MPTAAERKRASSRPDQLAQVAAGDVDGPPEVGWSRPPSRFSSVDLPEPDLPSSATRSPRPMAIPTPSRPAPTSRPPRRSSSPPRPARPGRRRSMRSLPQGRVIASAALEVSTVGSGHSIRPDGRVRLKSEARDSTPADRRDRLTWRRARAFASAFASRASTSAQSAAEGGPLRLGQPGQGVGVAEAGEVGVGLPVRRASWRRSRRPAASPPRGACPTPPGRPGARSRASRGAGRGPRRRAGGRPCPGRARPRPRRTRRCSGGGHGVSARAGWAANASS